MSTKDNSCLNYHSSVTTCPNCREKDNLEIILIADLLIDGETERPYAMHRYRCGTCQVKFGEEPKWWE